MVECKAKMYVSAYESQVFGFEVVVETRAIIWNNRCEDASAIATSVLTFRRKLKAHYFDKLASALLCNCLCQLLKENSWFLLKPL